MGGGWGVEGVELCQAVQDLGYKLSKPYILQIFDAKAQAKATFGDYTGLCKLMCKDSKDIELLLDVCGAAQTESIVKSKCEGVLLQCLRSAIKLNAKNKAPLTALGQVVIDEIGTFTKAAWLDAGFVAESLKPGLDILSDVVTCRTVDVRKLDATLKFLEDGGGETRGVLVEFLIGQGKAFYAEAVAASDDRRGEIANQERCDQMQASVAELCDRSRDSVSFSDEDFLNKAAEVRRDCKAIKNRKKKDSPGPCTQTQLDLVSKAELGVTTLLDKGLEEEMRVRIELALVMCAEALQNDGLINQHGLRKALSSKVIRENLMAADSFDHQVWNDNGLWKDRISSYRRKCEETTAVMDIALNTMPTASTTVFDQVPPTTVIDAQTASLLEPWLKKCGVLSKTVESHWNQLILKIYLQATAGKTQKTKVLFANVLAECRNPKFVGLDKELVDTLLCTLPPRSAERNFIHAFVDCSNDYAALAKVKAKDVNIGKAGALATKADRLKLMHEVLLGKSKPLPTSLIPTSLSDKDSSTFISTFSFSTGNAEMIAELGLDESDVLSFITVMFDKSATLSRGS